MKKYFKAFWFVVFQFLLGVITILTMASVGVAMASHSFWFLIVFGGLGLVASILITIRFGYEWYSSATVGFLFYSCPWILAILFL